MSAPRSEPWAPCSSTARTRSSCVPPGWIGWWGDVPDFGVQTIELDLPEVAGGFGRRLHDAGVPVEPERAARFAAALRLARPVARRHLYWTARAVFISDPSQVRIFDRVFADVFGAGAGDRGYSVIEDVRQVPAAAD